MKNQKEPHVFWEERFLKNTSYPVSYLRMKTAKYGSRSTSSKIAKVIYFRRLREIQKRWIIQKIIFLVHFLRWVVSKYSIKIFLLFSAHIFSFIVNYLHYFVFLAWKWKIRKNGVIIFKWRNVLLSTSDDMLNTSQQHLYISMIFECF